MCEVAGITTQRYHLHWPDPGLIGYLCLFGWYEMMNSIYTGAVASYLLKTDGYFVSGWRRI